MQNNKSADGKEYDRMAPTTIILGLLASVLSGCRGNSLKSKSAFPGLDTTVQALEIGTALSGTLDTTAPPAPETYVSYYATPVEPGDDWVCRQSEGEYLASRPVPESTIKSAISCLEAEVFTFVRERGIQIFMEEVYNVLGTSLTNEITPENLSLSRSFGLPFDAPSTYGGMVAFDILGVEGVNTVRKALSSVFARNGVKLGLSQRQTAFLRWHFSAPDNYSSNLVGPNRVVVGWNSYHRVEASNMEDNIELITYGAEGCHVVMAYDDYEGALFQSHYDSPGSNPEQFALLRSFLQAHPRANVVVVGLYARTVAEVIIAELGPRSLSLFVKDTFLEESYAVSIARHAGRTTISHSVNSLTTEYADSVLWRDYSAWFPDGRWYPHGRFGEIFPQDDTTFIATPLELVWWNP